MADSVSSSGSSVPADADVSGVSDNESVVLPRDSLRSAAAASAAPPRGVHSYRRRFPSVASTASASEPAVSSVVSPSASEPAVSSGTGAAPGQQPADQTDAAKTAPAAKSPLVGKYTVTITEADTTTGGSKGGSRRRQRRQKQKSKKRANKRRTRSRSRSRSRK